LREGPNLLIHSPISRPDVKRSTVTIVEDDTKVRPKLAVILNRCSSALGVE
jgi:hypothetical protein